MSACPSAGGADRPLICPSACALQIPVTSRAAKAPGAGGEGAGASSAPLCFPAQRLEMEKPDSWPRQQWRDGTHGKQGWRSHWFPLGGSGLVFGLCWKDTLVHSSRLQPSTRSPGVATQQHHLLHTTNIPCDPQNRKTASSQLESCNHQLWVCLAGSTLTPRSTGAPAPAGPASVASPSPAPEPAEHS